MSATPCAARPTNRGTAIEMAVSGIIGLCASFVLSIEAWQLAADQGRTFSCDVSSVLSCSAVAATPQARVLGFPNAFLGLGKRLGLKSRGILVRTQGGVFGNI